MMVPTPTPCATEAVRAIDDVNVARSVLLDALYRVSCHLPRSLVHQCIAQVLQAQLQLQQEENRGLLTNGKNDVQKTAKSLVDLIGMSNRNTYLATQKSAKDLFRSWGTEEHFLNVQGTLSTISITCGTDRSVQTCLSSDSTLQSNATMRGRIARTLKSVERLLEDDMSMSSSEEEVDLSEDCSSSCSSSFLSSDSDTTYLDQLSMEFDLLDTPLLGNRQENIQVQEDEDDTEAENFDGPRPKPRMDRRLTGLRRVSASQHPQSNNSVNVAATAAAAAAGSPIAAPLPQAYPIPGLARGVRRSVSGCSHGSNRSLNSAVQSSRRGRRSTTSAQRSDDEDTIGSVSKLRQGRLSCRNSQSSVRSAAAAISAAANDDQRSVSGSIFSRLSTISSQQPSLATRNGHAQGTTPPSNFAFSSLPTCRYTAALVFVDVSGFSRLSTMLSVEVFSKIIHDYFQKIILQIELHGGDIVKFAGDAMLVEWKVQDDNDDVSKKRSPQQAAYAASLCASNLVDLCSDFFVDTPLTNAELHEPSIVSMKIPIRAPSLLDHLTSQVGSNASLNLHASVGFGQVIGTHVGDRDRVEYVILGDALRQVTSCVNTAKLGQVVVSPEAALLLREMADIMTPASIHGDDQCVVQEEEKCTVIAYKRTSYLQVKPEARCMATSSIQPFQGSCKEVIQQRCRDFTVLMLEELYGRLAPYLHPVALAHEVTTSSMAFATTEAATDNQEKQQQQSSHLPLAEIRDACTIFIQPDLPLEWLLGKDAGHDKALRCLNQIMLIACSEVDRFNAHLRQFIVDDKGLVIIVNFGLRGSTFPNQVAERVMPFMDHICTLLKSELDIGCRIGTTHGRAYCGLIAPGNRTEYTVLGPSVNLAARLMVHIRNPGILVDEPIQIKAGRHRPFRSLCPIRAKGYSTYVRIFIPEKTQRSGWKECNSMNFVGRRDEVGTIVGMAQDVMENGDGDSKMIFLEGSYGIGKSALLSHCTQQVETMLQVQPPVTQQNAFVWRHVCCDKDSFTPFSIVRPLFLDMLGRKEGGSKRYFDSVKLVGHAQSHEANEIDEAQMYVRLLHLCLEARVPLQHVEAMAGLVFSTKLSDIGTWSDAATKMNEWNRLAQFLCQVFVRSMRQERMVLLALDNVSGLDEMSWKLLQGLFYCAQNVLILGAARSEHDLNISPVCWNDLNSLQHTESDKPRFLRIELEPMTESEVSELVMNRIVATQDDGIATTKANVARTVYLESKGNPLLAEEILDILYPDTVGTNGNGSNKHNADPLFFNAAAVASNMDEVVLNRLDSLPPAVRFVVDVGALLGSPFLLVDLVAVLERYHNMPATDTTTFTSAKENLQIAVDNGLLNISSSTCDGSISYTFSHSMWLETISRQNLNSWKNHMRSLINEVMLENGTKVTPSENENSGGLPRVISFASLGAAADAKVDDYDNVGCNNVKTIEKHKGAQDDGLDPIVSIEQNTRRLLAMAKMFRRNYKNNGHKGATRAVRKFKALLSGAKTTQK